MSDAETNNPPQSDRTYVGDLIEKPLFESLSGVLAGHQYVKIVIDRLEGTLHVLDSTLHDFHAPYIGKRFLGMKAGEIEQNIDEINTLLYNAPDRRFLLATLSMRSISREQGPRSNRTHSSVSVMVLETSDSDTMSAVMLTELYRSVRNRLVDDLDLYLMPASHDQERALKEVSEKVLPRISSHQLHASSETVSLNLGTATGRFRYFAALEEYARERNSLTAWDIVAMPSVPDDVPRVAGLINGNATSPLSHTNMLAAGWGIPNAIIRNIERKMDQQQLDGKFVRYEVDYRGVTLEALQETPEYSTLSRAAQTPQIVTPNVTYMTLKPLDKIDEHEHSYFGTKAANLALLSRVIQEGNCQLLDYYTVPRPPRKDLLSHLAQRLGDESACGDDLKARAQTFLANNFRVPNGIAASFSFLQHSILSSRGAQTALRRLDEALGNNDFSAADNACTEIRRLILTHDLPQSVASSIIDGVSGYFTGRWPVIVRSSSNAEDVPGFSAAGLYDSIPNVSGTGQLIDAVRAVWASLYSERSVRLRHEVGINTSLAGMAFIVQEYIPAQAGGVMVTCNPSFPNDFRNVYLNCSRGSASAVVDGTVMPLEYLFNTVEGGGRTVALGSFTSDLDVAIRGKLAELALAGRLLQSAFSQPQSDMPSLDIEWIIDETGIVNLLQVRPFRCP